MDAQKKEMPVLITPNNRSTYNFMNALVFEIRYIFGFNIALILPVSYAINRQE